MKGTWVSKGDARELFLNESIQNEKGKNNRRQKKPNQNVLKDLMKKKVFEMKGKRKTKQKKRTKTSLCEKQHPENEHKSCPVL